MASRKIDMIPLFVGDLLYAVMIYFIVRFLFIKAPQVKIACSALLICYLIECSQIYQAEWINTIRNTTLGHLVLGQGFLWSDLVAYTFGVGFAFLLEKLFFANKTN